MVKQRKVRSGYSNVGSAGPGSLPRVLPKFTTGAGVGLLDSGNKGLDNAHGHGKSQSELSSKMPPGKCFTQSLITPSESLVLDSSIAKKRDLTEISTWRPVSMYKRNFSTVYSENYNHPSQRKQIPPLPDPLRQLGSSHLDQQQQALLHMKTEKERDVIKKLRDIAHETYGNVQVTHKHSYTHMYIYIYKYMNITHTHTLSLSHTHTLDT